MKNQMTATYDADSKRYHRFLIDPGHIATGVIYIPKGKEIPDSVTIYLTTTGEKERKHEAQKKDKDSQCKRRI